jgi:hypothetical protein
MSRRLPTYSLLIVGLLATFGSVGCKNQSGHHGHHGSVHSYGGPADHGTVYEANPEATHHGRPLYVPPTPVLEQEPSPAPVPEGNILPPPPKPMPLKTDGNDVSFPTADQRGSAAPALPRLPRAPKLFNQLGNSVRKIFKPIAFLRSNTAASQQVADPFSAVPASQRRLTLPIQTAQVAGPPSESLRVGYTIVDNSPLRPVWLQQPNLESPTTQNSWEAHLPRQASPSTLAYAPLSVPAGDPTAAIKLWPHSPRVLNTDHINATPINATPINAPPPTQQPTLAAPSLTAPPTGLQ